MDASNSLGSGISDPGVLSDNGSNNLETNNSDSSFKNMEKDLKPKPHHKYDKKREHGGDEPVFANRGGMRGQGKKPFTGTRGNHQGGRGGRGGMHAGGRPFPPKSPEEKIAGPREDEGEWKTVERSGPKNRHPRGAFHPQSPLVWKFVRAHKSSGDGETPARKGPGSRRTASSPKINAVVDGIDAVEEG
eukprot:352995-Hanusia_phi.AAC.2